MTSAHLRRARSVPKRSLVVVGVAAVALSACHPNAVVGANDRVAGGTRPNQLSTSLSQSIVAQGNMRLENGTAAVPYYGYLGDGPLVPAAGDLPSASHKVEASKTEPDKNTYLVLSNQTGGDPSYNYGTHFLFQGHEGGSPGYITRINLDADVAHRVTLLGTQDTDQADLPDFDGSTWDPWAQRLLLTAEGSKGGGVWQSTTGPSATIDNLTGILGQGGYEGIQNDSVGNIWIVEDIGGAKGTVNNKAKQQNSFVYRFVPTNPADLKAGGRLEALQVQSKATPGSPISFHPGAADSDILGQDAKDLHAYGKTFTTSWVTLHDTAVDGTTAFSANTLAKTAGATPFKRPENGVFRPGLGFTEFYFTETGDTDANTQAGADFGGFGAVYKLSQYAPNAAGGTLSMVYRGDVAHTGLDNLAFRDKNNLVVVEDAGDALHGQRNALDSAFEIDVAVNYGVAAAPALTRVLAEGRDASATIDAGFAGMTGYQNDGDNEITGIHISNGDPGPSGVLGAFVPTVGTNGWRVFWTQQHGDNITWEVFNRPG